ncbi:hypothetical protein LNKW23_01420 [Paralimibaculum aggregatum]|uniref:DUF4214 domain-containing protein n=2 Tax=Paralimibaculum aggregatum TaxID=3036245 RepID=A0ABQ6LFC0_9RHOB|nr:hypothetical protein LNKW23_01420 [Limibaculum sp. NKW23]
MDELTLSFAARVSDQDFDGMPAVYGHLAFDPGAAPAEIDPETREAVYPVAPEDARLVIDGVEVTPGEIAIVVGNDFVFSLGSISLVVDTVAVIASGETAAGAYEIRVGYGHQTLSTLTGNALPESLPAFTKTQAFGTAFFAESVAAAPLRAETEAFAISEGEIGAGLAEAEARFVAYLYEAALDRDGAIDAEGLNFWIDAAEAGLTRTELAEAFLAAPEFTESFGAADGLSETELVDRLYENVLDRAADGPGQDFWREAAAQPGIGPAELLIAFATSEENRAGSPQVELLVETEPGLWAFL